MSTLLSNIISSRTPRSSQGAFLNDINLMEQFIGGGDTTGIIGDLGWALAGTGATWGRGGLNGHLKSQTPVIAALNSATIGLLGGDVTGAFGIHYRSTSKPFEMFARMGLGNFAVANKPSSWSLAFATHLTAATMQNRIVPNNGVGICAIMPEARTFAVSTAFAVGDTVLSLTPNGRRYICTTAGATAATEPVWPITYAGTVVSGTATFSCAGLKGDTKFQFFVTGADALVSPALAASTVNIPTQWTNVTYDLRIEATSTGYRFSVNDEDWVSIANVANLTGSPVIAARNDHSRIATENLIRINKFGFYAPIR